MRHALVSIIMFVSAVTNASPLIPAGDLVLRHDIQILADAGIIKSPVTSWPLAWGAVLNDIEALSSLEHLSPVVRDAYLRVAARGRRETRVDYLYLNASSSLASRPAMIRGFENSPREEAEASAEASWTGDLLSVSLAASIVNSPADGQELRADGSMAGIALGNYTVAFSTMDRWWGPGWDGSLILSNNARPIPAIVIDRTLNEPFRHKWLSWMGPWDVSILWGQLESDRHIRNARFFGLRLNFRPLPSLEVGVSRTAQWCGEGRPCGVSTFIDLLTGNDNIGDSGVTAENEAGNQMAGFDVRWTPGWSTIPVALYGQMIGEDEAGGFPSRYLAQFGVEAFGSWQNYSWRWFGELAGTSCDFLKEDRYNCAYNQAIYETGYRYRGRVIGHGADNDAKLFSTGLVLVENEDVSYRALFRYGELNRDGDFGRNTVAPTNVDIASLDLFHSRKLNFADLAVDIGLGYERLKGEENSASESRLFLRLTKSF